LEGLDDFGLTFRQASTDAPAQPASILELAQLLGHEGDPLEPEQLAQLINTSEHSSRLGWKVYQALRDLVLEAGYDPAVIAVSHDKAARLLQNLKPELLASALASQANIADRRKLLKTLVDNLPSRAIEVAAIAGASSHGKPFSAPLAALVTKLETEARTLPEAVRHQAQATFHSLVHETSSTSSMSVSKVCAPM
jgi:hypothetical protein